MSLDETKSKHFRDKLLVIITDTKTLVLMGALLLGILLVGFNQQQKIAQQRTSTQIKAELLVEALNEETTQETDNTQEVIVNEEGVKFVDGIVVVNKKNGLPSTYAPGENATAKEALVRLMNAMRQEGFAISDRYSGYRSYSYQEALYNRYVIRDGQLIADTYSARPGYSEHQTGLAFDLFNVNNTLLGAQEADAKAVEWLRTHAHEYGFIVRYLPGKEDITGYMAESWHIRYIGEKAKDIYISGLSLEEYLRVEGGNYE